MLLSLAGHVLTVETLWAGYPTATIAFALD